MAEDTRKEQEDLLCWDLKPQPSKESDDLEQVMWGMAGVPLADAEPAIDNTEKITSTSPAQSTGMQSVGDDGIGESGDAALESVEEDTPGEQNDAIETMPKPLSPPMDEDSQVGVTCIAWKKRSGLGKYYSKSWERRRLVLLGTKLMYYDIDEDEATAQDNAAAHATFDPTNHVPRGVLDLVEQNVSVEVAHKANPKLTSAPTPFETHIVADDDDIRWRFCFDSNKVQMEWLAILHDVLVKAGTIADGDTSIDADRFEHDFEAGDHIIRWEMIIFPPVIYPIQIHGIVLEAGRNCVIVADFGLTGYGRKEGASFGHADDHAENDLQDSVMAAWKKFRPAENQRLNIVTLTDPKEIRKWHKADYLTAGFGASKKKTHHTKSTFGKLSSFFGSSSKVAHGSNGAVPTTLSFASSHGEKEQEEDKIKENVPAKDEQQQDGTKEHSSVTNSQMGRTENGSSGDNEHGSSALDNHTLQSGADLHASTQRQELDCSSDANQFDEPDWFAGHASEHHAKPSVFSLEEPSSNSSSPKKLQPEHHLPKSDPKKIVLARTNFLLEFGEEVLPPYHVFYSNSECIAVWCKTGRWSTLQTAVFLTSTSVGSAKSATVATLGIAAAHAVLAPVVAVGGLLWVSAPMVILKKSRDKWENATMKLTDLFWAWAPSEVFVEAIENWSDLR